MSQDAELLRQYAERKSNAAFAELVQRHIDLVYSVALRQVAGDAHLAQDVTQIVFASLARKAGALVHHAVLGGWLYRTTQYAATDLVRREVRRRAREQEANQMQHLDQEHEPEAGWDKLRPLLDRAISELKEEDRDAVVLRFFNGCSFSDIGARMRLTENAARMRVQRALDRLHGILARHGCTSTGAALAAALAQQVTTGAPAGLAASVAGAALAGAGGPTLIALLMSTTKFQVGSAAGVVAVGAGGYVHQAGENDARRTELLALRQGNAAIATLRGETRQLAGTAAEIEQLRADDLELARLRDETAALKARLTAITQGTYRPGGSPAAGATSHAFDISRVDQRPKPLSQSRPEYPLEFRQYGVPGEARVSFEIDEYGLPRELVAISSTHPAFAEAAVTAIKQWKFKAALKGGIPVRTRVTVPIVFSISGDPKGGKLPEWF
jgi:RNA polymerase sigma factor (sigma-70 family)